MPEIMRNMSGGVIVLVCAALGLSGWIEANPPPSDARQLTVAPATGLLMDGSGYSFAAPDGWSVVPEEMETPDADLAAVNLTDTDGFADNVSVMLSRQLRIEAVESQTATELKRFGASQVEIRERVVVAGSDAAHVSAAMEVDGTAYQIEQFYITDEDQTFVVTFSFSPAVPQPDRDALAESVLASWSWV